MRLVTYSYEDQLKPGAMRGNDVVDISAVAPDILSLIMMTDDGLAQVQDIVQSDTGAVSLEHVKLAAPIPVPRRNIMCLGLNYAEHAKEHYSAAGRQTELPEYPLIFTKATTTVNGPFDDIHYEATATAELDWEVELAVIIGKEGKNISAEKAMDYVYGYTVLNDLSARDLQRLHKQFFKGKSLDGTCPMGPWIVTKDQLPDPQNLQLVSRVNGLVKQDSNTSLMLFNLPSIIEHLSLGMSLLPGDIIATGTPSGVGFARQPPEFLKAGDVVECEIEGIGVIRNVISAA
jgi:2-keto-4-pentenoate hydratase/2-oxohepta-3-ene-1,7-dioic acid hydratase in catechol pathway